MSRHLLTATFDAATQLMDGAAPVTANGAGQVGGSNKILNVGPGFLEAALIVDVSAMDITTGDEGYTVALQGSSSATFASDVNILAEVKVGAVAVTGHSAIKGVGRYQKSVINSLDGATAYPYLRAHVTVAGTTPSITATAFLTKDPL